MTIEKSPAPSPSHVNATHGASQAVKARPAASDAANPNSPGGAAGATGAEGGMGFLSILGALSAQDGVPADAAVPLAIPQESVPADQSMAAPVAVPFDINALLQQNPNMAAAQALQAATDAVNAAKDALGQGGPDAAISTSKAAWGMDPALLAQAAVLGGAGLAPVPTPVAAPPAQAGALPGRKGPTLAGAAASQAAGAQAAAAPMQAAAGAGGHQAAGGVPGTTGLQQAHAQALAEREDLQAGAKGTPVTSQPPAASERAEQGKFMAALEQARAAPEAVRSLEALLAPQPARPEKARSERNALGITGSEPSYVGTAQGVGMSTDSALSAAQAPGLAPEMQVAEQVSYWVSQNVQNAELTLDGLGQLPVEVSISMQGNEAQIAFRTDERATRELLERAGVHLQELLQNEGLVLGGLSVGNSGSGPADGRERSPRQNVRQTAIAPLQTAVGDAGARPRTLATTGAGQSVDLFV